MDQTTVGEGIFGEIIYFCEEELSKTIHVEPKISIKMFRKYEYLRQNVKLNC